MDQKVQLNNGLEIQALGLGTWKSEKDKTAEAVFHAIKSGYRHIDCAFCYENQDEVGSGIAKAIDEGIVTREQLFITSKLWITHLHREDVEANLRETLSQLSLEYLDLFLIHWPYPLKKVDPYVIFPEDENGTSLADPEGVNLKETWGVMEEMVESGLIKSIGISNFTQEQIGDILDGCRIKPVCNQIECHPFLNQAKLKQYMDSQDIKLVAYSPFGNYFPGTGLMESPMENETLKALAKSRGKTCAQLILRWQLQRGNIAIPKSVTPSRIEENANIMDFELSSAEMETINVLGLKNIRYCNPDFRPNGELAFPGETTAF
mmetsp:Transcript_36930/g.48628  ORF Transcript_36930/g.48628 Transcript_36930/m.48628 type:complete len:320 (-) Transcript_36930:382-1341(-)